MRRILVVDDDFDICESLQLLLEPKYAVVIAYNGAEALERIVEAGADGQRGFDAIVLDLMMPVMDGEELMRELHQRNVRVPVVLASAANQLGSRARMAGAAGFLQKPFDAAQLEGALEQVLCCQSA